MAWINLLIAGGLEVFWSTFLKLSEGFTRPLYSVIAVAGMTLSFFFLAQATKVLPLGTASGENHLNPLTPRLTPASV